MKGKFAFYAALASVIVLVEAGAGLAHSSVDESWIITLAIDPSTPTTLYASTINRGVFKSTDGGANWSATGLTTGGAYLVVDPLTTSTLYAATSGRVSKTTDSGATWSVTGPIPFGDAVGTLAIDPMTPTTLYAGGRYAYKSTNGGGDWAWSGLSDDVQALAIDPLTPSNVYAGTDLNYPAWDGYDRRGGVFRSTDGGASWSTTGLTNIPVSGLAIDPWTPTTLYALIRVYCNGLQKSTDAGASWNGIADGPNCDLFQVLAIDPLTPTTLYAGTEGGVLKSTDGGATWGTSGLIDVHVFALVIDPVTPHTVYAGTKIGLLKSTDAGLNWNPTGPIPGSYISTVSLNPTSVPAGTPSTGTVTLSAPAPVEGAAVALSSSDAVATVPVSVTVPAGATSGTFTVSTSATCGGATATISATYLGVTRTTVLTVTPATMDTVTPATVDTVTIKRADYFPRWLLLGIEATSSISTATLQVFVTSSGELIGTLQGDPTAGGGTYGGLFTWPVNPQNVTVRSSSCGSATRDVRSR